jgi:general secretion pathway protein D
MRFHLIILFFILIISSCDKIVEQKYLSSDIQDNSVKKMIEPIEDEYEDFSIPKDSLEPEILIPENLKQKVSLILNERLSVKSVLCETAKKLDIDFQIDPKIDSRIIFQAHQKPFIEILDAICDISDLRYTIVNGFVKVIPDTAFTKTYDLQFLNFSRDSENKIAIATEVSSNASEDNTNKVSSSSDSTVTVKTKNDFWSEIENGIKIILQNANQSMYSINKQSGIITIHANSKTHKQVVEYIQKVKESTISQVLIEAKIIEVHLKNEYRRGINWDLVSKRSKINSSFGSMSMNGLNNEGTHGTPVTFSYKAGQMHSILNALEEFGSTRAISNPRITAMNNQAAILKVAQNHVYFKLNYDKTYLSSDSKREDIAVSSDIKTIPIGLVMFVQPSIDISDNSITLFLRPTITKLTGDVSDPAVDIALRSIDPDKKYEPSKVPITEVREIASVLRLNDGEIAVLGGFMEVRSSKNKAGLPGVRDIPLAGELVSSYGMGDDIVELVILIKVKIIRKNKTQKAADIRLQRFVPDPRPF